jgi:putative ABC transport system ATP-binding protein
MIELLNVSKVYPAGTPVNAIRGVSLRVATNDYVGILGPSGSGKSTLLNLMGLLDVPTEGEVRFDGRHTATLSDAELSRLRGRSIGFVFQSFHLIPHLSVMENVELPLFYQGTSPRERRARAEAELNQVNLGHRLRHLPRQLSGGECQRAAIARALVTRPSLVLADEPTGNLDSASGGEILSIFGRLHAQGKTLVVITHEPAVAQRIPRLLHMVDGRVREDPAP